MNQLQRRPKGREKGSILAVALLVSVFMVILVIPFVTKFSGRMRTTEKSYRGLAALSLAEAGVERGIWEMNYGNIAGWSGSSSQRTLALSNIQASGGSVIGNITINVYNPGAANPVVESAGTVAWTGSNTLSRTVRVVLQPNGPPPLFNYGVFAKQSIALSNNALVDSYDSRNGAYGGSNVGSNGDIGTNSTAAGAITLNNNATVNGDAFVGYQGNPATGIVQGNNSTISGTKAALSSSKSVPDVPAPTGLTNRGNLSVGNNGSRTISASGQYGNFSAGNNAIITINADCTLYITGTFTLNNNAQLRITNGARVQIFFGGGWSLNNNCQINNASKDPTKLLMFGTDTFTGSKTFSNNTATYAAMYFPKADLTIYNNGAIYGSVIAKSINLANNAAIHFDEALLGLQPGFVSGSSGFSVLSWQEKIV
jgi:Tfp pilus assembly protein PilX